MRNAVKSLSPKVSSRGRDKSSSMMDQIITCFIILTLAVVVHSLNGYTFAEWGDPCKTGADGSILKPHEECEQSKGIQCQHYDQGEYCGCQINSVLTYDHSSRECRRKVGVLCKTVSREQEPLTPFNHKCHTNAECVQLNTTSLAASTSSSLQKEEHFVCLCKQGYYATSNFNECVNKNGGGTGRGRIPIMLMAGAVAVLIAITRWLT